MTDPQPSTRVTEDDLLDPEPEDSLAGSDPYAELEAQGHAQDTGPDLVDATGKPHVGPVR